jgi:hypothetical protein
MNLSQLPVVARARAALLARQLHGCAAALGAARQAA